MSQSPETIRAYAALKKLPVIEGAFDGAASPFEKSALKRYDLRNLDCEQRKLFVGMLLNELAR
jgi:hypothetical protein